MLSRSHKSAARAYSTATIKQLFGLCSNQCAEPDCTNEIIAGKTRWSKAAVVGHICHIYAASDNGPRGKVGLTEKERRSPENLILLCGSHHPLVDKQWQTYPAGLLKKWKAVHEAKATKGTAEAVKREADIQKHAFVQQMSDEQIEATLRRIRQSRYLMGFPTVEETLAFATQVDQSRYAGGSDEVRARALAWCARILSYGDTATRAKELLQTSIDIAVTPEATIAQAFITAPNDSRAALASLAKMKTPQARSAALRIVMNKDGAKSALEWVNNAGLTINSFDAEGKFLFITAALDLDKWGIARDAIEPVTEDDFVDCPALLFAAAMARLLVAIPDELKPHARTLVPFEATDFPLMSKPEHLQERRNARVLFSRISTVAHAAGVAGASNVASDYALWLGLRDPDHHDSAMAELRESMNDSVMSLRRVNFAIRFGLKLDLTAIEQRIDQSVALSGYGSADEAFARLSLAFTKGTAKAVAEYIDKHRAQLYKHLDKSSIAGLEIEVLARAGLMQTAKEKLEQAERDGLSARNHGLLERIIAEASGSDPIAERRSLYESSGELHALVNLTDELEKSQLWPDLLPYAEKLFQKNPSVEAYERLIRCKNELARYDDLVNSLSVNQSLVDQSRYLKAIWAWTLYREGRFTEATVALQHLPEKKSENARALRVNIAIASGAWDKLVDYCAEIWENREQHSARDLLHTAQLSIAVDGLHSRDLVTTAIAKKPDSPEVLLSAYTLATQAGWEQSETVGGWLNNAARLSGDNGPLKRVSLKELVEQKPEWDKQAADVWEQLQKGGIPAFGAGRVLNRSLLDLYLLPSLINPTESDIRRRNVVFAYSGARIPTQLPQPDSLALDLGAVITFARLGILNKVLDRYRVMVPHSTLGWLFQERQKATYHQPSRIRNAKVLRQLIANGTLRIFQSTASPDKRLVDQVGRDLAAMLSSARDQTASGTRTLVVRSSPIFRLGTLMEEEADVSGYESCICSCAAVIDYLKLKGALTKSEEQKSRDYLKLQERPRPDEPAIDGSTEIYLDELSISYLQTVGALGKFKTAGLKVYIPESEQIEANALLSAEDIGKQQLDIIEYIRSTLAAAIASGRACAVRSMNASEEDVPFELHPTYGVLGLVGAADAIVVDDRFINQHSTMTHEGKTAPLLCSLDVLDFLRAAGDLTPEEVYAHRTLLRQAGYQLITVTDDELEHHLKNSSVDSGELTETAELRAIRESLLRARMGALVQIPLETQFLFRTHGAYIRAIKRTWENLTDRADTEAHADYLLSQLEIRAWASSAIPGNERGFALYAHAAYAMQLMTPPLGADAAAQAVYYEWITDRLLKPIKEHEPEIYAWMLARFREMVISGTEEAVRTYEAEKC